MKFESDFYEMFLLNLICENSANSMCRLYIYVSDENNYFHSFDCDDPGTWPFLQITMPTYCLKEIIHCCFRQNFIYSYIYIIIYIYI